MYDRIKQDPAPLVITNIIRNTNMTRNFVSVRKMRQGDVTEMFSITLGEL